MQITTLLIGSAFFTVQAVDSRPPPDLTDYPPAEADFDFHSHWQPASDSLACFYFAALRLNSQEYTNFDDVDSQVPYELTVNYDSTIISIRDDTSGTVTYNGLYPHSDDIPLIDEFELIARPPLGYNPFVVNTTLIRLSGTLNGVPIMPKYRRARTTQILVPHLPKSLKKPALLTTNTF